MVQACDNDQLLYAGEDRISKGAQILGHPHKSRGNSGSKPSSHRPDNHKEKEGADQRGEQRRHQQTHYLRNFLLKEEVQLCCNDTDEKRYDNASLESYQFHRQAENVQGRHLHGSLGRRISIRQTAGQHNASHNNPHDRSSAEPLYRTVSHAQRKEAEDCAGRDIDQGGNAVKRIIALHKLQVSHYA